jgi:hypothetical protein
VVDEAQWQDMPEWLSGLVAGRPAAADVYRLWEDVWKPELAKRGVTPDMLEPVGDPAEPLAISATPPSKGWRSGAIEWETDGDFAILQAIRRLIAQLDA